MHSITLRPWGETHPLPSSSQGCYRGCRRAVLWSQPYHAITASPLPKQGISHLQEDIQDTPFSLGRGHSCFYVGYLQLPLHSCKPPIPLEAKKQEIAPSCRLSSCLWGTLSKCSLALGPSALGIENLFSWPHWRTAVEVPLQSGCRALTRSSGTSGRGHQPLPHYFISWSSNVIPPWPWWLHTFFHQPYCELLWCNKKHLEDDNLLNHPSWPVWVIAFTSSTWDLHISSSM